MRPATLRRYAREAGFRDLEVLPVNAGMLRFYRLTPSTSSVRSERRALHVVKVLRRHVLLH